MSDEQSAPAILDLMMTVLSDGLDHPELWSLIPGFVDTLPDLPGLIDERLRHTPGEERVGLLLLLGMCGAALGQAPAMLQQLESLSTRHSQSPLVQGALFHLKSLIHPDDPRYRLEGKICPIPFVQADVLDGTTHLCCASWLGTSIGNMATGDWQDVWNSDTAQAIRASVHDGSYRYCNKTACPSIQSGSLPLADDLRTESPFWQDTVDAVRTALPRGPESVNLAYDRTCNLACPSCRTERFAADKATRGRFEDMQERTVLPLLESAKLVFVTGSGDPFASKNFRRLLQQLTPQAYPNLRFQIMTNGMLFTPRQWADFPAIHRRVAILKISIDAATGPTHELLRRGARWPVMLENLAFAGRLLATGDVDDFELIFTVQRENYREMGDAVDLAKRVGAHRVRFSRITNWGTFTEQQYRDKAVFLSGHPDYDDFLAAMADPRLREPAAVVGDLDEFLPRSSIAA